MKRMNSKAVVLLITIAVLLTVTVGTTAAYLMAGTPAVTNVFEPGKVPPEIVEELDGDVKKNVTVRNTGNVDAYIRAKIVVTWQDGSGNVYPKKPAAGTDYSILINETDWDDGEDGFWYHKTKVGAAAPDNVTEVLIRSCTPVAANVPSDYTLHVEILAQAIQAEPDEAVEGAWGVKVTTAQDGTKTISK